MFGASLLFATMGVCVKFASADYSTGEIVFYRGVVGAMMMALVMHVRSRTLRTNLPAMHAWRSLTGVSALWLWFYAIAELPLATAVTLNYMSPIWMALLLIGGSTLLGGSRVDARLTCTVLVGFTGVMCVLQPTMESHQLWGGMMGLLSGLLAAIAYLQVTALGKAGEPEDRVVFYFSVGSIGAGALATSLINGWHAHTFQGMGMLLAVGVLATLAQLMMTRAYRTGRILANASLQYLGIAWSFFYGVLLFDDPITGLALLGMGLIAIAGITAVRLRASITTANRIDTTL
ncbi:MAG: DMT family transporter [Pseudomonadota bacterium]|nr:DMT family transporter [Pseudomonadota bacterium]